MKQLSLLRHAKSSWDDPALGDIDRPLSKRGRRDSPAIGAHIAEVQLIPDLVLCSSSRRTRDTYDLVNTAWTAAGRAAPVLFDDRLYMAEPDEILGVLRELPDEADRIMVLGHNPGIERLADLLTANARSAALARLRAKYPTGALAAFELDIKAWRAIAPRCGRLTRFVTPRELA